MRRASTLFPSKARSFLIYFSQTRHGSEYSPFGAFTEYVSVGSVLPGIIEAAQELYQTAELDECSDEERDADLLVGPAVSNNNLQDSTTGPAPICALPAPLKRVQSGPCLQQDSDSTHAALTKRTKLQQPRPRSEAQRKKDNAAKRARERKKKLEQMSLSWANQPTPYALKTHPAPTRALFAARNVADGTRAQSTGYQGKNLLGQRKPLYNLTNLLSAGYSLVDWDAG